MDYSQIRKIVELQDEKSVNKYLESGWVIINIYNSAYHTSDPRTVGQQQIFTLGWPSENGDVVKPDLDYSDYI